MNNIKRARKGKKIIVKYPQQKGHKKYRINLEKEHLERCSNIKKARKGSGSILKKGCHHDARKGIGSS
jgi:hypothetical protein